MLPLLREHLQENPFWDHLEELRRDARDLAKTIDLAVEAPKSANSIEGIDKLQESWCRLNKRKNLTPSYSSTPVFPAPNWEEIKPPHGDIFAARVCKTLAADKLFPDCPTFLWNIVKKLAELNEYLNPDTVEHQIATTTCSECKEIKHLLGNKGYQLGGCLGTTVPVSM